MNVESTDKKRLLTRLRRAEGQLAAVRRMIDEDAGCVETLIQIAAIQGALAKIGERVLGGHIESCVADAFQHGNEDQRQQAIDELMDVFSRYGRIGG